LIAFAKSINRPKIRLSIFVTLYTLYTLVAFQDPLWSYARQVADPASFLGVLQLTSLQILQITLMASFLYLWSLIAIWLMKIIAIILVMTNSVALYFISVYGIEIDRSMIANILNTDARETGELMHISMAPYILILGVLPAAAIVFTKITPPNRMWRLAMIFTPLLALVGFVAATSHTMLWYDQHSTRMGSRILPWSYIVNTGRHFNSLAQANRPQELLPNATFANAPAQKTVVVLVIGEAARGDNFSLLGYERPTNPFTQGLGISAFPIGQACATNTIGGTACILTHQGSQASSRTVFEPLPNYLKRHGIFTIYRSNNSGPPPIQADIIEPARKLLENCAETDCPDKLYDEILIDGLSDIVARTAQERVFIFLHQTGSHGPAYSQKYPPDFEHFKPVCDTVQVSQCSYESLRNAYDNTIRYTDYHMAALIKQLGSLENTATAVIYVSDHGQSLGENGYYLHGAPVKIAPPEQLRIPFWVWMSPAFKQSRGLSTDAIVRDTTHPHDFPFHSVMGAFGMQSDIYKPEFDVFAPPRN